MYLSRVRSNQDNQASREPAKAYCRIGGPGLFLAMIALLVLAAGCESSLDGNGMADSYYLNPYKDLSTLGRVALVELDNNSGYPSISPDVTQVLFTAL